MPVVLMGTEEMLSREEHIKYQKARQEGCSHGDAISVAYGSRPLPSQMTWWQRLWAWKR